MQVDEDENEDEEDGEGSDDDNQTEDDEDESSSDDNDSDEDFESKPKSKSKMTPSRSTRKKVTPTSSSTKLSFSSKSKSKSKSNSSKSKSTSKSKVTKVRIALPKMASKAGSTKSSKSTPRNALIALTNKICKLHSMPSNIATSNSMSIKSYLSLSAPQRRFSNSLFLSLLSAHKKGVHVHGVPSKLEFNNNKSKGKSRGNTSNSTSTKCKSYHENDVYYTQPVSPYTTNLVQIAHDLVQRYNETNHSTAMHIDLLNLLFFSIGGTVKSMLVLKSDLEDEEDKDGGSGINVIEDDDDASDDENASGDASDVMDVDSDNENHQKNSKTKKSKSKSATKTTGQIITDLEELDEVDWDVIVTELADDMTNTPDDCTPLCCDPNGATHWTAMKGLIADAIKGDERNGKSGRGRKKKGKKRRKKGANDDRDDDDLDHDDVRIYKSITVSERDVAVKRGNATFMLGAKEYRSIYEEFWYVLGTVALVEGGMSSKDKDHHDNEDRDEDSDEDIDSDENSNDSDDDETDDEDEELLSLDGGSKKRKKSLSGSRAKKRAKKASAATKKKKTKTKNSSASTLRFDTDIVNDILNRISELIAVGIPDARAAATTAAIYMLHAIVDKSAFVQERLEVTSRQYAAAIGSNNKKSNKNANAKPVKLGAKAKSLKHQIDSLKRTSDELEHIIESVFINSIFMHRYRDSNMYIRAECLKALGRMAIIRPDLFLVDKYLKYLGWMLSDKAECVRIAALESLHLPFQVKESQKYNSRAADKVDLLSMERVIHKFLPRIVDSVIDIHDSVQERGMEIMLSLMRSGFLDESEEGEDYQELMSEEMWDQVNLKAIESDTTPIVRRDALYFIMEQLEDFDDGNDEDIDDIEDVDDSERMSTKKKRKSSTGVASGVSNRRVAQRLDAIASWAAHTLTTGRIPIEKIRIHLVDHLVHSLRAMPEHKSIVTNWSAMVRAITSDNLAMTSHGTSAGERADVAKQRILVQMLICAAKAEVGAVDADFLNNDLDPDVVEVLKEKNAGDTAQANANKKASSNVQHESLSVELIKALPNLLVQFKSDSTIIESLVSLPRYFSE